MSRRKEKRIEELKQEIDEMKCILRGIADVKHGRVHPWKPDDEC